MNFSRVFACLISSICFYSATTQADLCKTHQTCAPATSCTCTITPDSGDARYFYFDFPQIQKGQIYSCQFTSTPMYFTYVADASTFPEGVDAKCTSNNCPRFPMTLSVNTQNMQSDEGTIIVKYFVPASDIPSDITANCTLQN